MSNITFASSVGKDCLCSAPSQKLVEEGWLLVRSKHICGFNIFYTIINKVSEERGEWSTPTPLSLDPLLWVALPSCDYISNMKETCWAVGRALPGRTGITGIPAASKAQQLYAAIPAISTALLK